MLLYFAIALIGTLFLVLSAVLGEVFDFFGDADADGDVHPLSGKVLATGMTAFGAAGMITQYYDWGPLLSAVTSALAAVFLGAAAWWMISALQSQTASTDTIVSSMRGRNAQVTVTIPTGAIGEVQLSSVTGSRHMSARAVDGSAIPAGTSVRVVESSGSVLLVEQVDHRQVSVTEAQRVEG
ncbi:MAG: NfeD family protein [Chloroflexota bacterium]|nr:NfeD family protein [Chloroflexota bacterium]